MIRRFISGQNPEYPEYCDKGCAHGYKNVFCSQNK